MFGMFSAQQDPFGSHSSFLCCLWSRWNLGADESQSHLQNIEVTLELIMRRKPAQKWIFPEDPSASILGKPSGGVGDAPHGHKDIGNHARSKSGIHPFSLDWDILGYLVFGIFSLGGIWDLRKKGKLDSG